MTLRDAGGLAFLIPYWASLAALMGASIYLLVLALAALLPARKAAREQGALPYLAVLIPAHNEEALLHELLKSLRHQEYPKDRFTVHLVADNCSDGTAAVGRRFGVAVHERHDPEHPGKGQALGWLVTQLQGDPQIEGFVFVDADSTLDPGFLAAMSRSFADQGCALQASYRVKDSSSHALVGLRALAFALMHDLRGRGKSRLGLSCGLWGNGMALSNDVVDRIAWRGLSAAEDAEQHLQLLLSGIEVKFVPEAHVFGHMPATFAGSRDQQQRWEGGRLYLAKRYGVTMAKAAVRQRSLVLTMALLELALVPLSLHVVLLVALCLASLFVGSVAMIAAATTLAAMAGYILLGMAMAKLPAKVYLSLLYAPVYVAWKVWLYAGQLPKRSGPAWLKTSRSS